MGYRLALRQVSTTRRLAERSPALFHPTQFPCTAWYVTAALNVRECTLEGKTGYAGVFASDPPRFSNAGNLFTTRDEAVLEAERRLVEAEKRHEKAAARLAHHRATVAKMKGGAA